MQLLEAARRIPFGKACFQYLSMLYMAKQLLVHFAQQNLIRHVEARAGALFLFLDFRPVC
jgi:hypothetical protein